MSSRTIHFPPAANGKTHEDAPARIPVPLPAGTPPDTSLPAIVIWGRMMHTARHINEQLKHLPEAADDYHGTLRVLVTAALAIEADAKRLLVMIQKEGGGAGLA